MQTYQPTDPVKNNSKIILWVLIISRIIIGVWIRRVFFRDVPETITAVDSPTETEQNAQRRYIGEKVLLSWELSKRSWFWLSTHIFVDSDWNSFGARSENVNLSEFEWEVQLKWEIVDFDKESPIILVQDIIVSGGENEGQEIPEWNPNFWYSKSAGLWIDLSVSQWYEVIEDEEEIRIVESTNISEPLLTIIPFQCVAWNALQDCVDLKEKFTRFGNETFTNNKWITFYNLTETNTWFIFDEPTRGYSLRSSTLNSVASFSDLIQIINEDTIQDFVEDNKDEYCRSLESSLDTIQQTTSTLIESWLLEITTTWASWEWNEVTCTIYAVLGENNTVLKWSYNDSSTQQAYQQQVIGADDTPAQEADDVEDLDIDDEVGSDDSQEQEVEVENENENEVPLDSPDEDNQWDTLNNSEALPVTDWTVETPVNLDGRLQYSSVRWFDMYFSKQWVSYVWEILDTQTSLWMDNAICIYKVNVIAWNQADSVSTNPDLAVFECSWSQPTAQQAQALNIQIAWNTEDSFFAIQKYTTNLWDIEVYVE